MTFQLDTSSVKGPSDAGLPPSLDGGAGQPLSDMVAKLMQPGDEEKKATKEREAASEAATTSIKNESKAEDKTRAELEASMPKPEDFGLGKDDLKDLKPEKSPSYKPDNPLQDFGGVATLLGIFGGMLTRRPLVTSLDAASGAMNAYHQRNVEDYEKQVEEWKNNQEYIGKVLDWREKMYASADKKFQNDLAARTAARTEIAARTQDTLTLQNIAAGNEQHYYQTRMDTVKVLQQMQDTNARLNIEAGKLAEQMKHDRATEGATTMPKLAAKSAELRAEANELPDGDQSKAVLIAQADAIDSAIAKTKGTESPGQLTDDAAKFAAERILAGDPTATVGLARSGQNMAKIDNALTELAKERGVDAGKLLAAKLTIKADSTSLSSLTKMTDAAVSFEKTAEKNFTYARSIRPENPNLGPWLNKWVMQGDTALGDPNIPAYVAAVMTGANEYAKIMAGSTGAQGSTVDSRREAADLFSPYLNTGQIDNVLKVAKQDMSNREASLYGQIDSIKKRIAETASGGTSGSGGGTYSMGQIIEKGGKKYRVVGVSDPDDPDVEPVP